MIRFIRMFVFIVTDMFICKNIKSLLQKNNFVPIEIKIRTNVSENCSDFRSVPIRIVLLASSTYNMLPCYQKTLP